MQAILDGSVLRSFTRALTCISKYGDEMCIYATSEDISFSATNSSKSAYCRFRYDRQFFTKYSLGVSRTEGVEEVVNLTGQLMTKSLLSILKHRTVEKSVERCELSIVESDASAEDMLDEDKDGLESKLIVRLHCKHGVIKTHRLLLLTPTSLLEPTAPDSESQSLLSIGPRGIRDIIEHFPNRSAKSDPQLIWNFGELDVNVKSLESSLDPKGKNQMSTELAITADEFDVYNLYAAPTIIAFHLREFNASIAFAESMALSVDLRFTETAAPLFITVEGDNMLAFFVISTSEVQGPQQASQVLSNPRKRQREETSQSDTPRFKKKPMKVVQETVLEARSSVGARSRGGSMLPPQSTVSRSIAAHSQYAMPPGPSPMIQSSAQNEPLFFKGSSQTSNPEGHDSFQDLQINDQEDEFDIDMGDIDMANIDEELALSQTQDSFHDRSKEFHPLFED
ncbi:Rad9-domain-containing protein [Mycena floridula]|nr:Rad9-domain-containing protein [Mycena floridula]